MKLNKRKSSSQARIRKWITADPWPGERQNRIESLIGVATLLIVSAILGSIWMDVIPGDFELWGRILIIAPALPLAITAYAIWRQWRPMVVVSPWVESGCLYLQVKNFGGGLARDVRIEFESGSRLFNAAGEIVTTLGPPNGIPILPSGDRYLHNLGQSSEYFNVDYLLGSDQRIEMAETIAVFKGVIFPWHVFTERHRVDFSLVTDMEYRSAFDDLERQHPKRLTDSGVFISTPWTPAQMRWAEEALEFIQREMSMADGWHPRTDFSESSAIVDALHFLGYFIMRPSKRNRASDICVAYKIHGTQSMEAVASRRIGTVEPLTLVLRRVIEQMQSGRKFPFIYEDKVDTDRLNDGELNPEYISREGIRSKDV